jgi:hypothetical protein
MFIEKLDDFFSEEASVSGNGIMAFFSEFIIFVVQGRDGFFNQIKGEKRLSTVKIEEIVIS